MISKKILLLVGISIVVLLSVLLIAGSELNDIENESAEVVVPPLPNESISVMDQLRFTDKSVLVVAPLLTANAYRYLGFYDTFRGECDETCLSLQLDLKIRYGYTSSGSALVYFNNLGIPIIDDYTISLNLEILDLYQKIIMLHTEYVTMEFYETITNHPNVYFMYPNALYAEIELNDGVMTLIKGKGYPKDDPPAQANAFDWEFENTHPDEYDLECIDFKWKKIGNGYQLNCYPEVVIFEKTEIMDFIFEDR
ncbi:MAG: hypothetical protein QQN52_02290 [Nitrosopumilus sp.]